MAGAIIIVLVVTFEIKLNFELVTHKTIFEMIRLRVIKWTVIEGSHFELGCPVLGSEILISQEYFQVSRIIRDTNRLQFGIQILYLTVASILILYFNVGRSFTEEFHVIGRLEQSSN